MKRALMLTAGLAALTLALSACGEKKESVTSSGATQSMTVMLDWFPNADHVGIYQALADGDFEKAGLNVHIQVPSDPALPLKLLEAGKTDVAISYEPEVMLARDKGEALVSVAAIVQEPLTSIVSIGSKHIRSAADLRGKRVGVAGIPYQHAYLTTILSHAHVPIGSVKETNVGSDLVPAMLSGRVDATLGAYWNYEAIQLQRMHKHPNVIRMDQVGVPTYDELVVVARKSTVVNHPDEIRRFVLEEIGIVGVHRQQRMSRFRVLGQCLRKPGREFGERITRRMFVTRDLQGLVSPQSFDEACAGFIRAGRDMSDQRRGFERCPAAGQRPDNQEALVRLKVEAHPDR